MTEPQVHERTGMSVTDITGVETWREYVFTDGFAYLINHPVKLYVKRKPDGDSHRVIDAAGVTHYVPAGWRVLRWFGETVT